MTLEAICQLDVHDLAAPNCRLYLWACPRRPRRWQGSLHERLGALPQRVAEL